MRCQEAQSLLTEYSENLLPELTRKAVDHHLADCASCRSEYQIWMESSKWLLSEKEQYTYPSTARSIVDAVMARILSEEKWAISIGRKVFTVTARMRRMTAVAAMLFLLLCGFTLYSNSDDDRLRSGVPIAPTKTEAIAASIEITPIEPVMEQWSETAAAVHSIGFNAADQQKPNYAIILSFFGIVVTVVTMGWLTRA